jgi:hypothetical protein
MSTQRRSLSTVSLITVVDRVRLETLVIARSEVKTKSEIETKAEMYHDRQEPKWNNMLRIIPKGSFVRVNS